jgi:hypothetical protein
MSFCLLILACLILFTQLDLVNLGLGQRVFNTSMANLDNATCCQCYTTFFSSSLTLLQNKLERWPVNFFQTYLTFADTAGPPKGVSTLISSGVICKY